MICTYAFLFLEQKLPSSQTSCKLFNHCSNPDHAHIKINIISFNIRYITTSVRMSFFFFSRKVNIFEVHVYICIASENIKHALVYLSNLHMLYTCIDQLQLWYKIGTTGDAYSS